MSVATRTEAETVADAICALLAARLIDNTRAAEACRVAGITLVDLNDARIRHENGRARPARRVAAWPNVEPVKGEDEWPTVGAVGGDTSSSHGSRTTTGAGAVAATSSSHRDGRDYGHTSPGTGGIVPTKPWVPRPPDPVVRDQAARKRHGRYGEAFCVDCGQWKEAAEVEGRRCRECRNKARRQRYLSVEREKALERAALRWHHAAGDAELRCARCAKGIDVDEECVMVGEVVCGGCAK